MRKHFLVAVCAFVVLGAACSSEKPSGNGTPDGGGNKVAIQLQDFAITIAPASAAAGQITINATNNGPSNHELVVMKTDLAEDSLPLKGDVVDEEGSGLKTIGEIAEFAPGTQTKAFDLTAGTYVLICNVSGHYAQGMHVTLEVA